MYKKVIDTVHKPINADYDININYQCPHMEVTIGSIIRILSHRYPVSVRHRVYVVTDVAFSSIILDNDIMVYSDEIEIISGGVDAIIEQSMLDDLDLLWE